MQLTPVESSMLYAIGYNEETNELDAVFWRSGIYRYAGVEKAVYEQLLAAGSIGGFMRANIIGLYPEQRLTGRTSR